MVNTKVGFITNIDRLEQVSETERSKLKKVAERFPFRANDYYLSLIDWDDPNDPIRKIIVPHMRELEEWGRLDPSNESDYTIMPGLEHKYGSTAVLLACDVCGGICRYCFRKRVFTETRKEHQLDLSAALEYIKQHTEVTNVLLTGGDPLVLSTAKLENIIRQLREIEHVQIIRIGTKMPVFDPYRVTEDPALLEMIKKYSTDWKRIYIMNHFVHPREMTDLAVKGISLLQKAGAVLTNQFPLIRGINDDPDILVELLDKLSFIGATPYYIFQCRPAQGNKAYTVPIEEGYEIIDQAKSRVSGLAKRIRYVMSHSSGKIEIIGKTKDKVYLRYHRSAEYADSGRFMVCKSNPDACWFDDYEEIVE